MEINGYAALLGAAGLVLFEWNFEKSTNLRIYTCLCIAGVYLPIYAPSTSPQRNAGMPTQGNRTLIA